MGLDSVDLVVAFEKYFGIDIPDLEAEKLRSVNDVVLCVSAHKGISDNSIELMETVIEKIQDTLEKLKIIGKTLESQDLIFVHLDPSNKSVWNSFCEGLGLKVPIPSMNKSSDTLMSRALRLITPPTTYNWQAITLDQFAIVVCADNYLTLIDSQSIKSKFEVYCSIMAITVDRIGIDYYEVSPEKEFVKDFRID